MNRLDSTEEFGSAMAAVQKGLKDYNPRPKRQMEIGETVRFLTMYTESSAVCNDDLDFISSWIDEGVHVLKRRLKVTDGLCFRNYQPNMNKNRHQAFHQCMGIALSLDAIARSGLNFDNSFWRETKTSLKEFCNDAIAILQGNNGSKKGQTWFVLFNLLEALATKGDNPELYMQLQNVVESCSGVLQNSINYSDGLHVYADTLQKENIIPVKVPPVTDSDRSNFDVRPTIYDILGQLSRDESVDVTRLPDTEPDSKPHLWAIARAWIRTRNGRASGIIPYSTSRDLDFIFSVLFEPPDSSLSDVTVDDTDLNRVKQLDDDDIQDRLVSLLKSNQALLSISRHTLSQEKEKPHTGAEISDFDIEIRLSNDESSRHVSFPIKSGVESRGKSANQLAEANLHQLLRPLTRFKRGVVFPILIAGASLNLQEFLKSLRSNYNLPLKFIDRETFTRILKANNLLYDD